jgi:hypothetical protein
MRIVNSSWQNLIIEEDCYFIALKPIRLSSYLKPCQLIISCESLQGWLPVAHFVDLEPKWRCSDSLVGIDHCQWPLIGRYLFEAYLTPHPLYSPCASHTLLAIQEHLVCGANSPCFGRAQMLSYKLTVIVHGPLGRRLLSVTFLADRENQSLDWSTFSWLLSPCNWSRTHWVKLV